MTNVLVMCKWMVVWHVFAGVFQPNWSDLRFPKSTPCAQTPGCPTRVSSPMPTNWNARTLTSASSVKSTWCTPKPGFEFLWLWCMCGWLWKQCPVRRTAVVGESCMELETVAVVFHYVLYALQWKCLSNGIWARQRSTFFLDPGPGFCSHLIIKFHLGCSASGVGSDLDTLFHRCLGEQYTQRGFKGALDSIILSFSVSGTLKKGLLKWK